MSISLKGIVSTPDSQSIASASVRLSASNQASGETQIVSWSRTLTNFSGNRWQCWVDNVRDRVQGITWDEFKDQYGRRGPHVRNGSCAPRRRLAKSGRHVPLLGVADLIT
jgi:hypothetical protein